MKTRLQWLEVMRGLAACWVLVHHADISASFFLAPMPLRSAVVGNGYLGVDFFFVLSGFIIAFSSNRLRDTGRTWTDYAQARLLRIYVPYLPIGIAMVLLYLAFPGLSQGDRHPGLLTSLTLLPSASPPALGVAWTLVHELLFYMVFSLLFVSGRLLALAMAAWASVIAYFAWLGLPLPPGWNYLLLPLNLCFLVGVLTYYATRRGVSTLVALASLAFGVTVLVSEVGHPGPNRWLLALAFASFIIAACSPWAQRRDPAPALLTLGAASYSIYLVHAPLLAILARGFSGLDPMHPVAMLVLMCLIALAAGLAYYYFYERPMQGFARRLLGRPDASTTKWQAA
jgi:peptidoglycan/LPS O-acetylase OafA/YrhL